MKKKRRRKFLDENLQNFTEEDADIQTLPKESGKRSTRESNKIVNAFGIYWNRSFVHWKSAPDLFGIQQIGASVVNIKIKLASIYFMTTEK